ncbi:isocitrate lyase/PEP mutase family protein [Mycobacterium spongiae]|uniref:Isocitrate lyase/phosphoenolpyruvate mutase family protein n=1 Tax=Mycobacterium spongiae TaxID=886343 RepID=A0A975K0A4_9MYCO|nr:isocitrate lyase/phosphoenolpyruvate mutase family protein [Mycobacterium spongiae]QUR69002.1 isocitrate lyase/phosphoenolpyruvate mutase family protein [Mycobacterium spongiae]
MSFRDLHYAGEPLLLPNAWDVPSALAFCDAGYQAIGTTSFGLAASSGHPDGGRASKSLTVDLARRLSNLPVYLTVDMEDGYDKDPDVVAAHVDHLGADLGVAGINIEDSTDEELVNPQDLAAKVAAIKQRCPAVFVNARVDTYWLDQDATVAATLERATAYVAAGADGIFVPGATSPSDLRQFAENIPVPLNVLAIPQLSLAQLGELGVRRISTGSLPYRAAIHAALEVAERIRNGDSPPAAAAYPSMQARLVEFERGLPTG